MSYYDVHKALTQSIIDLSLGVPIAHENTNFDPDDVTGNVFVDLTLIPNEKVSLSKDTVDELTGIYQVSVYVRSNKHVKLAYDVIEALSGFYKHNVKLTSGSVTLSIDNFGMGSGRNLDGWYVIDNSITFRTLINR